MKYIFDSLSHVKKKLAQSSWALILDFDLTLSPLAANPAHAVLPKGTKILLRQIAPKMPIAIVTGRSMRDIKKRVGLHNIVYVGNHGLEYEIGHTHKVSVLNSHHKSLRYAKKEFIKLKKKYPGVIVEDKKFSVALHYRLVSNKYRPALLADLNKFRSQVAEHNLKGVLYKKTLEIKPDVEENKGTASVFLLKKLKRKKAIYIGDGRTDEDAFRALVKGVTIRVGKSKNSAAKYYVRNIGEVKKFLSWLS